MTTRAMTVWRARMRGEDPEQAAADWDRAAEEREAEENPVCPIDGEPRDPRLKYCSADCCAEDEGTDLSPTGRAGDRRRLALEATFSMPAFANALLRGAGGLR